MFSPQDRGQARAAFFRAWRRYRDGLPLEGVEKLVVAVALRHPEYHAMLDHPDNHAEHDYPPETGVTNPFLHMSLHIALEEQLSVDQPKGIRGLYRRLQQREYNEHEAQHRVMDCLADTLWRSRQDQDPPDERIYFECLERLLRGER
jgi:hypothetical protein